MHKNFTYKTKVYYEDTDAGGVVYYANYLNFLERARTEAITSIGLSNKKIKKNFDAFIIVKACNIQYKLSAYLEDELLITSFIKSITKTSFMMLQRINRKNDLISEAEVHLVFVNNLGKPTRIPEQLIESFKPFIKN
ncbi:YbgC/FadM family acyl-CoA thioesterase [Candidatus Pelagibacter sp.]|nr:YbgC/FadM family acyl-CoA thioesterase [Candidatus Pelagibacter sp.]